MILKGYMMKKITLKEKIGLITAYAEGKPVEAYDTIFRRWFEKGSDSWDFDREEYRVKPEATTKFKVGDVLVNKKEEGNPNPTFFLVEEVSDEGYVLDNAVISDLETIEKEVVSERDVLWYFEWRTAKGQYTKDFEVSEVHNDTLKVSKNYRLTIDEAIEVVKNTRYLMECYPMRVLGFRLRKDITDE